jgi:hypothetical protein
MIRRIIKYGKLLLSKNKYKTKVNVKDKDKCKNKDNCYAIAWIKYI